MIWIPLTNTATALATAMDLTMTKMRTPIQTLQPKKRREKLLLVGRMIFGVCHHCHHYCHCLHRYCLSFHHICHHHRMLLHCHLCHRYCVLLHCHLHHHCQSVEESVTVIFGWHYTLLGNQCYTLVINFCNGQKNPMLVLRASSALYLLQLAISAYLITK